jgi:hypothetical protein
MPWSSAKAEKMNRWRAREDGESVSADDDEDEDDDEGGDGSAASDSYVQALMP